LSFVRVGVVLTGVGIVIDRLEAIASLRAPRVGLPVAAAGCLLIVAAATRFFTQRSAIERNSYHSHLILDAVLISLTAVSGIAVLLWVGRG